MLRLDSIRTQHDSTADHVPQLPNIAGPRIPHEHLKRLVREATYPPSQFHAGLGEKQFRQVHDVVAPLSERRDGGDGFVQAGIKVPAERARLHLRIPWDLWPGGEPPDDRPGAATAQPTD